MSRKPADKLRPNETRQAIWDWIRKNGSVPFMVLDVEVRLSLATVRDYLTGLCNAGFLECTPSPFLGRPAIYKMKKDNGQEAPRVRKDGTPVTMGLAREKMWIAMGIRAQKGHTFTARDLTVGSTKDIPVSEVDAKSYCSALHRMGRLVEVEPGSPGKLTIYRMPRNKWTGPKPVQIQRTKRGFDPNTGEAYHLDVTSVEGGE
ncbi:hypothetical protein KI809_10545 [Geobacter pelophilus]|uniref:Uncharacterized protein n=1 Tax=Geoanaerobacter pelophilus TaxID=60036 RepID=A0AAW4L1J8_9BACT|nr:hypothetical protein [Geoanaerobacter pelophilus]MBT0664738.1 hypothetical protein [Geoanaerobacter pelophilus]